MIHGKLTCPKCSTVLELSATMAPAQQSQPVPQSSNGTRDLGALLDSIHDVDLKGAAAKFVAETRERYEQYGNRTRMSEKQFAWLESIASGEADQW